MHETTLADDDPLTDDAITGDFRVWQRVRGHRYSLDDVATAWEAALCAPGARRCADLGSGIGSVAIMLAWKLREARFATLEAQTISLALARRNVERNALAERFVVHEGDLRDEAALEALGGPFELVTGTPPYLPPDRGSPSTDSQRTHARIEMRGGVEAYLAAAARILAPGGRFVVCCDARRPERVHDGARVAGLAPIARRDAVPRAGKGALFSVWTLGRAGEVTPGECVELPPLVARDEAGVRTAQASALREFFGLTQQMGDASPQLRERTAL